MYEVYGYSYLTEGIYGDLHICDCKTLKQAAKALEGIIDGLEFTGGSVYKVGVEDYTAELVYSL